MPSVKMLTMECGPNGNFNIGELRTVTFEQGENLVETRHAVWVDKGEQVDQAAAAEQAAAEQAAAEQKRIAADNASQRKPARR